MRCPYCATERDKVVDSRPADDGRAIRRRRECTACGQRFSTYERVDHAPLAVRKRSGSLQPFDPDRLSAGIQKATANLDIDADAVRYAAARVEAHLRAMGRAEIGSDVIGGHVLEALRALHPVAYMRFASVHKSFTSADDFARELAALDDPPTRTGPG
jgi:transcriptional repressor NrdR